MEELVKFETMKVSEELHKLLIYVKPTGVVVGDENPVATLLLPQVDCTSQEIYATPSLEHVKFAFSVVHTTASPFSSTVPPIKMPLVLFINQIIHCLNNYLPSLVQENTRTSKFSSSVNICPG